MVKCKLCNREFNKQITNTHLRQHNITIAEYVAKFGKESLTSPEYRNDCSQRLSGENNPNFGNHWNDEQRKKASDFRIGKPSVLKGRKKSPEECKRIKEMSVLRAKRWKETCTHPFQGKHLSDEHRAAIRRKLTGTKLSVACKLKMAASRIDVCVRKRLKKNAKIAEKYTTLGFNVLTDIQQKDIKRFDVQCRTCGTRVNYARESIIDNIVCKTCHPVRSVSDGEISLRSFIDSLNLNTETIYGDRGTITPFELDVFLPEKSIAVEYCGLWFHSEMIGKSRFYHRQKYEACRKLGIRLIQIFEDEWIHNRSICEHRLRYLLGCNQKSIYARNAVVSLINQLDTYDIFDTYHFHGRALTGWHFGLFHENKLKMAMAIGETNDHHFKIFRLASSCRVQGGASKLFNAFVQQVNPLAVVAYSDLRWDSGNVYKHLGFNLEGTTIPKCWYFKAGKRHRNIDPQAPQGWNRIWDVGHQKWVWRAN